MIQLKEKNNSLSTENINYFIENLNSFSDEEVTLWLKAVKNYGLNDNEISDLTLAMAKSGQILLWSGLEPTIDKHSTGGIGDKITLLFVPMIAAYGINIPKLSGRGLGVTGGTIDKLESITGFRTNLNLDEIKAQIKNIGLCVTGAMKDLAPADKRLYAIRDVTGTVDSIPLIASSVMSKKIACGSKNIILDVKFGSGAFMKDLSSAVELAEKMVMIGKSLDKKIKALVTNMNEPLGYGIGNSLEVLEVLDVLSGKEVNDLVELTISLGIEAISLIENENKLLLEKKLRTLLLNGEALKKIQDMVQAQGGNLNAGFKKANHIQHVLSQEEGLIENIDAKILGEVVHSLGAGREKINDVIDFSAGIKLLKKRGDKVKKGDPILELHSKNMDDLKKYNSKILSGIRIGNELLKTKLIEKVITAV